MKWTEKHEWTEFPTEFVWAKICVHGSSRYYFDPLKLPLTTSLGGVCSYIFPNVKCIFGGGVISKTGRNVCPEFPKNENGNWGKCMKPKGEGGPVYTFLRGWGCYILAEKLAFHAPAPELFYAAPASITSQSSSLIRPIASSSFTCDQPKDTKRGWLLCRCDPWLLTSGRWLLAGCCCCCCCGGGGGGGNGRCHRRHVPCTVWMPPKLAQESCKSLTAWSSMVNHCFFESFWQFWLLQTDQGWWQCHTMSTCNLI